MFSTNMSTLIFQTNVFKWDFWSPFITFVVIDIILYKPLQYFRIKFDTVYVYKCNYASDILFFMGSKVKSIIAKHD